MVNATLEVVCFAALGKVTLPDKESLSRILGSFAILGTLSLRCQCRFPV